MTEKNEFTIDNPIMYDSKNGRCRCLPIPYKSSGLIEWPKNYWLGVFLDVGK